MSKERPPLRLCPRCRITMQAGKSRPSGDYDTFTCMRCDLVLSYREMATAAPQPQAQNGKKA